jgi:predicted N-acetyltransferase YhbS
VASEAFRDAFLYTPLGRERFKQLYLPLREVIDPELVLIATRDGATAGFVFALPDLRQRERSAVIDTAIIKTVAVSRSAGVRGLGTLLVQLAHERAHRRGYRQVIHALMHETNISRNISARFAKPIRRYALLAKHLGGTR